MKVACLGAGYFAQFHHDAWTRIPGVELVGVCDMDMTKALVSGAPAFCNFDDMLEKTRPDIIDIITPPDTHVAAIHRALEAKPSAIICQKPFGNSLEQAKDLTKASTSAGIPLIVHENFRFQPWYRAIKGMIDQGQLGPLNQATFRLRPGDGQGPNAYLDRQPYFQQMDQFLVHETGVHWIDTFRYLMGRPVSVYADLRRLNPAIKGEDAGFILFEFEDGARAVLDGNRLLDCDADNPRTTMGEGVFESVQGTAHLSARGEVTFRAFKSRDIVNVLPARDRPGFGGDCVKALQMHVVSAIKDSAPFENLAQDYLLVRQIEDAVYRSAGTGQKQVIEPAS